jgi:leucyl-tRNA---protein transferase
MTPPPVPLSDLPPEAESSESAASPTRLVLARAFSEMETRPAPCPYLSDRQQTLALHHLLSVSPEELDLLLARGYRRFGFAYFRPTCACLACDSLRVPVASFVPSKTQRRALRGAQDLEVRWNTPQLDAERVALYTKWHRGRETTRGWRPLRDEADDEAEDPIASYAESFCLPHPCARELSYWLDGKLVAVGIVDAAADALSAVYCYYDPDFAKLSLGVVNVLVCLQKAEYLGLRYVYLGYRVEGCPSLRYKGGFRPHEILQGRPATGEPTWILAP